MNGEKITQAERESTCRGSQHWRPLVPGAKKGLHACHYREDTGHARTVYRKIKCERCLRMRALLTSKG